MPSTETPARRTKDQGGASLVESVVASALLGVTMVAGITAWDVATLSARTATRQARAACLGRAELEAVLAAPWSSSYPAPPSVSVQVRPAPGYPDLPGLQQVTVTAVDPASRAPLYQVSALKARALSSGGQPLQGAALATLERGCPGP
jgi:Tfp pilus assembly protein PilV